MTDTQMKSIAFADTCSNGTIRTNGTATTDGLQKSYITRGKQIDLGGD